MFFKSVAFAMLCLAASSVYGEKNTNSALDDFQEDMLEFDEFSVDIDGVEFDLETAPQIKQWRLNLAWQNGVDLNAFDNTRSHRFDTRIDWGQLIFDNYFLKFDGKVILRLPGDDNQSNQAETEFDGRLRELYVQSSGDDWTLTAGFQTLSLGELDAVQVMDVLSPWDYSEFAFTTPEDARLGQLLFNVEWYTGQSRWQLIYNPWPMTNRYPGGDTSIIRQLLGDKSIEVSNRQPKPFEKNEYLLKWQQNISGSDVTLIYGHLLSNDPIFNFVSSGNVKVSKFETEYFRFDMFAMSVNYSAGKFLWKVESAYKSGLKFPSALTVKSDALDVAFGVDYVANSEWNLSVEIFNQHIFASSRALGALNKNNTQLLARWSKNWRYETLSSVLFVSYQLQYGDVITSLALDYAIDDNWKASIVGSIFDSSDAQSPGQLTKNWDQVTFRINFSY